MTEELTPQETAAIAALMTAPTIAKAAGQVGANERTLRRWLADNEPFRRALRREQRAAMAVVTSRLQQVAEAAVSTLEEVIGDAKAPHASRVTAARAILELAHERIDVEDLTARLEVLERGRETR